MPVVAVLRPRAKRAPHKVVLDEILEEHVVSGRKLKRKMGKYRLQPP
jgi:hypothetical protein